MIIKLKNADFSANNIGKINITKNLSEDTAAILAKYSRTLSNDQKFAFEDFFHGLKDAGIWSSIKNIYIPFLAGSLSEVGINAKTLTSDITVSSDYYELSSDNAIKSKTAGTNVPAASRMKILFNGSQMNYHFIYVPVGVYPVDGVTYEGLLRLETHNAQMMLTPSTNSKSGKHQSALSGRLDGNVSFSAYCYPTMAGLSRNMDIVGIAFGTNGITTYGPDASGDVKIIETAYPDATLDDTYTNEVMYLLNSNSYGISNSYGVMSVGTDLTDTQLKTYNDLAKAFKSAMLA